MVLFWPIQQELDCVNSDGRILGKIRFDGTNDEYVFDLADESIILSAAEKRCIAERIAGLISGSHVIPMQDDD